MNKVCFSFFISLLIISLFCFPAFAEKTETPINGIIYEFDEDTDYTVSQDYYKGNTNFVLPAGKMKLTGDMQTRGIENGVVSYEVLEGDSFTISYTFNEYYLRSNESNWHIIEDDGEEVYGTELDDDIDYGAVILLTSLDHEHWYLDKAVLNVTQNTVNPEPFQSNEVQLSTGCYYRIIVAYMLGKEGSENKRVAELYEFHAQYKSAERKNYDQERHYEFKENILVNAGSIDGFAETNEITTDDIHFGWKLGAFYIDGYTADKADTNAEKKSDRVFVKSLGDSITLWFNLEQDIDKLNDNSDYKIAYSNGASDQKFGIPKTYFKRGALLIRYTDRNNHVHEPVKYFDFLSALASPGANTKVQFYEEGYYEVALDYEIDNREWTGLNKCYRMSFSFRIVNDNNRPYLFELTTDDKSLIKNDPQQFKGGSLLNKRDTKNGFMIDLTKSKYLNITVSRAMFEKGVNGYYRHTEEISFSNDQKYYTEEGIYTITTTSSELKELGEDVRTVYVIKDNKLLKALISESNTDGDSIEILAEKLNNNQISIDDDGWITEVSAKQEESISETMDESAIAANTSVENQSVLDSLLESDFSNIDSIDDSTANTTDSNNNKLMIIIIIVATVIILVLLYIIIKQRRGKKNEKS
ncbi:hypothetical protein SAMN02910317_00177 [Ruminococcaceae bacterium FB2012]|nr:hypothetical protein SAMN02910317_00177 [Ruminococcaceae bacterium FB2012]